MNIDTVFLVRAFDQNGNLMREERLMDAAEADGFAAGLHVHYGWDSWVNDVQIFSHLNPHKRLVSGVID
jgi:hypothetical protein